MNEWRIVLAFPWSILWQASLLLGAGLLASLVWSRRPARAHAALLLAIIGCFAVPGLGIVAQQCGWGLISRPRPDASMPDADPTSSLALDAPRRGWHGQASSLGRGELEQRPGNESYPTMSEHSNALVGAVAQADAEMASQSLWSTIPLKPLLLSIWAAASMLLMLRLSIGWTRAARTATSASVIDDPVLRGAIRRGALRLGTPPAIDLRASPAVVTPSIWCWRRKPIVLLPADWRRAVNVDWAAIFAHELAHWRRRDHISSFLADIIVRLMPWNPLAWIARTRLAALAERACDDWAVPDSADATDYADSLLMLVPARQASLGLAAVSTRRGLMSRIPRLLTGGRRSPEAGTIWFAAAVMVASSIAAGVALAREGGSEVPTRLEQDPGQKQEQDPAHDDGWYPDRLAELADADWRTAFGLGEEIASLPPERGWAIVRDNWAAVDNVDARRQFLKAWYFRLVEPSASDDHSRLVDVLHLGMTDESPKVQEWSINYLKEIAFQDFAEDFPAYQPWYERAAERPLEEVMSESCQAWVGRLNKRDPSAMALTREAASVFRRMPAVRDAAFSYGLPTVLESVIAAGTAANATPGAQKTAADAIRLYGQLDQDDADMRRVLLPLIDKGRASEIRSAAAQALGVDGNAVAIDPLLKTLTVTIEDSPNELGVIFSLSTALGEIGDPSVVPTLIGLIESENTHPTVYGVGYFALGKLTGVQYDEAHDGAWWRGWWTKNKDRYPAAVRTQQIPQFPPVNRPPPSTLRQLSYLGPDDQAASGKIVDGVEVAELRVNKDENKQYFLIGPRAKAREPKDGWKLLLVLPGGDGSKDFHNFVRNIALEALPNGYLVAQLVAPKWRDDENRIVWPTVKSPDERMKFPTEQLIKDVVEDVAAKKKIDRKRVFALAWSSGGPAVYAASVTKDTPLTGAFVAMSVFKPETMPPLKGAKGKPYYILHSPQDFIQMRFPEAAVKQLTAAGATVKLQKYEGGHGWHGDVFGNIRRGVEWLEKSVKAESKK